jgi:site-specific recombinase XerD
VSIELEEPLEDLVSSFVRTLRAERKADNTIAVYTRSIRAFIAWLEGQDKDPVLGELSRENLREWFALRLETAGVAVNTVKTDFRGLRRLCRWAVKEDLLVKSPMEGFSEPQEQPVPVPVLTDAQLTALLKTCNPKTFEGRRAEVIMRLLMDTGLRVFELCQIGADVDLDEGAGKIVGKGRKERFFYFGNKTARAIDRYKRLRRHQKHADADALLIGKRGPLTTDGIRLILHRYGALIGVPELHPHMFRHTYAHDFRQAGGQDSDLKQIMGWSSDAMLPRYGASMADARARNSVRRLSRGDRI